MSLIMIAAKALATADEVELFMRILLRIFSQRFCPTDFYQTDRMLERLVIGLNFQQLTFGGSDTEEEPHSSQAIIHRRAISLFDDRATIR
jgi:hypothetical protein